MNRISMIAVIGSFVLRVFVPAGPVNAAEAAPEFVSARPVWVDGRAEEKNLSLRFRTTFDRPAGQRTFLRITGSSLYRIYLNAQFIGHGPARGPHGYYRVDEWELPRELLKKDNYLTVDAAGYNVNSYYLLDQPAFLQAEVVCDGAVIASTGKAGRPFEARILTERVQKVQRYSFQRPFIEYYRLNKDCSQCHFDASTPFESVPLAVGSPKSLLPRRIAYPRFERISPTMHVAQGRVEPIEVKQLWKDRSLVNISDQLKGYRQDELDVIVSNDLQKLKSTITARHDTAYSSKPSFELSKNAFAILDLGVNLTGFVGFRVTCDEKTKLYVTFDEILHDGDVDFKRLGCVNAVTYELGPGTYPVESFEPYTLRYLKFIVVEGKCTVRDVYLREYANDETDRAAFACSDNALNRIYDAARQTFRQNAVDIFMDCPSRERAGWLCDSFFMARVASDLTGSTTIEKNFIENFLLPERFEHLPEGMLPMCYPADHNDRVFIPNWAMWFVVQLEEYLARSGDRALVDALKPRVLALIDYFKPFRNEDGLLEKLQSWVFVEWSKANEFVQDVSYPSNMLYAQMLDVAGRLYDMDDLVAEASKVRATVRSQSFDGQFFVDNAVRKDGKLIVTKNHTEICQYAAFFFGIADDEKDAALRGRLCEAFGPDRPKTKAYPHVHPANAFIGNYLRLELISRWGLCRQLKEELSGYFLYMADQTGTLWENVGAYASCNHGFASHVAHCLYRDILGLYRVDSVKKTVTVRFAEVGLDWCSGTVPTPDGAVALHWWIDGDSLCYKLSLPAGYTTRIENPNDRRLVRK